MSYNPENLPRTDGLELALLSEAENAEDYRDLWGPILDDEVFKKIDDKLTEGEADLDVASVSTERSYTNIDDLVEFTDDGAWTWFNGDRAVHADGTTYTGWVNSNGDIVAAGYDHSAETLTTNTLKAALEADDHNAPGLLIQSDGTVTYAYTDHLGSTIYVRNSSSAHDISSFNAEISLNPSSSARTYPNLHQLGDGTIYLLYRRGSYLSYMSSSDGGSTWSSESDLVTESQGGKGVYFQAHSDTSRIDIGLTYADGAKDGPKEDIRHIYFDGSNAFETDGTSLTIPVEITNATLVYDSGASGNHDAWVWDCVQHASDDIEIVFAEFVTPEQHVYRYASWDGASWSHHRVCDAGSYITTGVNGERYYSAGIVIDKETPGRLFASIGDGDSSTLQEWVTGDNGETWKVDDYAGGTGQTIRPAVPKNRHEDLEVLYLKGQYQYYKDGGYETGLVGGRGGTVPRSDALQPGVVRAHPSSITDLVTETFTAVPLDSAETDVRGEVDSTNNQIVVEESGVYLIDVSVAFKGHTSDGEFLAEVEKNGSDRILSTSRSYATAGDIPVANTTTPIYLNKGDTIQLLAYQDTGTESNIQANVKSTRLAIYQLR